MLAAELHNESFLDLFDPALSEIYSSTISLHHAKEGYDYPTIRTTYALKLAGLPTRIYQTIHEGALAFLVVVAPSHVTPETALKDFNRPPLHGGGRVVYYSNEVLSTTVGKIGKN